MNENYFLPGSVLLSALILFGTWTYTTAPTPVPVAQIETTPQEETLLPPEGVLLPVTWGDLSYQLAKAGVIDVTKLPLRQMGDQLAITSENADYLLNLFWALGLSNKNPILEKGEMVNPAYGGPNAFASTGGWTIAIGNPMDHYSAHTFLTLTESQQKLVDTISRGIYRPCCNNSTHFPDCNHGMAMLGLLELMASQGVSEQVMWDTALVVNSYWFPDTYITIAEYMKQRGVAWENVNPQEILGASYSSASGFRRIASRVVLPKQQDKGSSCSV